MVKRKKLPKIKEFNNFLPEDFNLVLEKIRRNSRKKC